LSIKSKSCHYFSGVPCPDAIAGWCSCGLPFCSWFLDNHIPMASSSTINSRSLKNHHNRHQFFLWKVRYGV
jgi:hypothetical protein